MKEYKINGCQSLQHGLKKLNKIKIKSLVVTDEDDTVIGTITDGDVRRALLSGANLKDSIQTLSNKNPTYIEEKKLNIHDAEKMLAKKKLNLIPITKNKILSDILVYENSEIKLLNSRIKCNIVIMAGGYGTRMEPFTSVLPKPLIPVNKKPIIMHIIDRLMVFGADYFNISINYKHRIIRSFFDDSKLRRKISYLNEREPLGTAGALSLLKVKNELPVLLTNCDVLFNHNLNNFIDFHEKTKSAISLVVAKKEISIPYGVCTISKQKELKKLTEKPTKKAYINTGMYLISSKILKLVPKNKFFHITDLISLCQKKNFKVSTYVIDDDDWVDIGQWDEYRSAIDVLKT